MGDTYYYGAMRLRFRDQVTDEERRGFIRDLHEVNLEGPEGVSVTHNTVVVHHMAGRNDDIDSVIERHAHLFLDCDPIYWDGAGAVGAIRIRDGEVQHAELAWKWPSDMEEMT